MRALALILLAISGLPLVAFIVFYSIDAGCFICLDGEQSGGAPEKWINFALFAAIMVAVGALLWRRVRDIRN